jgi:hypothetical protein
VTGEFMEKIVSTELGHGRKSFYAANDPNLRGLSDSQKEMTKFHKLFFFISRGYATTASTPRVASARQARFTRGARTV